MRLLAWDTSSKAGALAALEWDPSAKEARSTLKLVAEWTLNVDAAHSEQLLWGIDQLLKSVRWKLEDVDVFGVGVGPGSFTGLRIGVTTARTLSHALGKPLVGVSSLAALVRPAALWARQGKSSSASVIVASIDASKGELFALVGDSKSLVDCVALADGDHPGVWKRGVEEVVLSPEDLGKLVMKKLGKGAKKAWIALGEGRIRYPDLWSSLPEKSESAIPFAFSNQIQGRYVAVLAWEGLQAGLARDPLEVHPRYLRASDAELKLLAGKLPPGPSRGNSGS